MKTKRMLAVCVNPRIPRVTALVANERGEGLASREWLLDESVGLLVHCSCGQEECRLRHQEIMPAPPGEIETQLECELEKFAKEFECSKIVFGIGYPNCPDILLTLILAGSWLDEKAIGLARASWLARSCQKRAQTQNTHHRE